MSAFTYLITPRNRRQIMPSLNGKFDFFIEGSRNYLNYQISSIHTGHFEKTAGSDSIGSSTDSEVRSSFTRKTTSKCEKENACCQEEGESNADLNVARNG
jgi:hypothetical protein